MLEELVHTLENLQRRIKERKEYFANSESRTRIALIDPMLCALGWDVSDPGMVQTEVKVADGRADYALLSENGQPIMFVEAKKLADTVSPVSQGAKYAISYNMGNNVKVPYFATTNGDIWNVYDLFKQSSIMEVSISSEDPGKSVLKFLSLWRRAISDGVFSPAAEPLVAQDKPSDSQEQVMDRPGEPGWVPLNGDFNKKGTPHPTFIRLPDGTEIATKSWRSVMIQAFLWLHQSHLLTQENCRIPFLPGRKRCIASVDGRHLTGTPFKSPLDLGNTGIKLEGNLSLADLVRNIETVLVRFGQDPAKVLLRLR